jgi:hypothetical protein
VAPVVNVPYEAARDASSRRRGSFPQLVDQRRLGGGDGGCNALGVCTVQFLADGAELTLLELADLDPAPPWAARMTAAYISFSIGRSPNACGMIFVRRRSSRKSRSSRFVVRMVALPRR